MKILKKILLWFVIVIAAIVVVSQFLPGKWEVTRTVVIDAHAGRVYPLINDITRWREWNAFSTNDPDIVHAYPTVPAGVGAEDHWKSKKFGDGSAKIVASDPAVGVTYELRFKAHDGVSIGTMNFAPPEKDDQTILVYTVSGENGRNPVFRIMGLFTDKFLGAYFEESLARMKALAEAEGSR